MTTRRKTASRYARTADSEGSSFVSILDSIPALDLDPEIVAASGVVYGAMVAGRNHTLSRDEFTRAREVDGPGRHAATDATVHAAASLTMRSVAAWKQATSEPAAPF